MNRNNRKGKKGFTMVELMIVVAIFGLMFILVSNTMFNVFKASIKTDALRDVRQNGDFILSRVVHELRNARYIESSSEAGGWSCDTGQPFRIIYYTQDGQRLMFQAGPSNDLRIHKMAATGHGEIGPSDTLAEENRVQMQPGTLKFICSPNRRVVDVEFTLNYIPFENPALVQRSEDRISIDFATTIVVRSVN